MERKFHKLNELYSLFGILAASRTKTRVKNLTWKTSLPTLKIWDSLPNSKKITFQEFSASKNKRLQNKKNLNLIDAKNFLCNMGKEKNNQNDNLFNTSKNYFNRSKQSWQWFFSQKIAIEWLTKNCNKIMSARWIEWQHEIISYSRTKCWVLSIIKIVDWVHWFVGIQPELLL